MVEMYHHMEPKTLSILCPSFILLHAKNGHVHHFYFYIKIPLFSYSKIVKIFLMTHLTQGQLDKCILSNVIWGAYLNLSHHIKNTLDCQMVGRQPSNTNVWLRFNVFISPISFSSQSNNIGEGGVCVEGNSSLQALYLPTSILLICICKATPIFERSNYICWN